MAAALTVFVKTAELYAENTGTKPLGGRKYTSKIVYEYSQKALKYSE